MAMFPWQLRVEGRRDEAIKRVVDEEMHVSMMGACGLVGVIRLRHGLATSSIRVLLFERISKVPHRSAS